MTVVKSSAIIMLEMIPLSQQSGDTAAEVSVTDVSQRC